MSKDHTRQTAVFEGSAAAVNTGILAAVTLADGKTTELTSNITDADVPHTLRFKSNQDGTGGLEVAVEETDILDQEITGTVTMGGDINTPTDSTRTFKTTTKITNKRMTAKPTK